MATARPMPESAPVMIAVFPRGGRCRGRFAHHDQVWATSAGYTRAAPGSAGAAVAVDDSADMLTSSGCGRFQQACFGRVPRVREYLDPRDEARVEVRRSARHSAFAATALCEVRPDRKRHDPPALCMADSTMLGGALRNGNVPQGRDSFQCRRVCLTDRARHRCCRSGCDLRNLANGRRPCTNFEDGQPNSSHPVQSEAIRSAARLPRADSLHGYRIAWANRLAIASAPA